MALATHQFLGSYATLPSRPLPWNIEMELNQLVAKVHMVAKTDRSLSLKCNNSCLSVGAPLVRGPRATILRISAFKGSAQNNESRRNSIKTLAGSPAIQTGHLSYGNEADGALSGSLAIQNLFKNWLTLLRTESPSQMAVERSEEPASDEPAPEEPASEMPIRSHAKEKSEIPKAVWYYFLDLDATVKIPLLIFIPFYLAVNMIYGTTVSKELTPLWVFGPLLVALYIKMFRGLCGLYVRSFQQTVKVIKNLPTHYVAARSYIAHGELQGSVQFHFLRPLMEIRELDYRELSKRNMKDLEAWMVEKYLDFVESIWPLYCRTIRFLKRANLM